MAGIQEKSGFSERLAGPLQPMGNKRLLLLVHNNTPSRSTFS